MELRQLGSNEELPTGTWAVVQLSEQERELEKIRPKELFGFPTIQFDISIPNGTIVTIVQPSYCGWYTARALEKEFKIPAWYLRRIVKIDEQ